MSTDRLFRVDGQNELFEKSEQQKRAEEKTELKDIFEVGQKFSIYKIDECMAMCWCKKITVREADDEKIIYTEGRGRKRYILRFASKDYQSAPMKPFTGAVFRGWDTAIKCDTEAKNGVMRGNACFNFLGTVEDVRGWIDGWQLNPNFDSAAALAITGSGLDAVEEIVYPELTERRRHAVIDRIAAKS